jgi:hypothetical protein
LHLSGQPNTFLAQVDTGLAAPEGLDAPLLGKPAAVVDLGLGSHYHFVPPPIYFIPYSQTYSVPLFLKRQCDRTLGVRRGRHGGG